MIKFKHSKDAKMFSVLHPILLMIVADADYYLMKRGHQGLVITDAFSTPSRDKKLGRKSNSHSEGRAVDFSIKGLSKNDLDSLRLYLETKYNKYGAISGETGKVNLFVYGDDRHLDHVHLQIHKKYSVEAPALSSL